MNATPDPMGSGPVGPGPVDPHPVDPHPALERLIFFSDAVVAIAITLLAFDLRLPDRPGGYTNDQLGQAIVDLVPSFVAFAISFLVIAAFWLGHYRTFRVVERTNPPLMAINFGLLAGIVLLPFATSLVARFDVPWSAALYATLGLVAGSLSTLEWFYPARIAGLVRPSVTPEIARAVTWRAAVVPIMFGLSLPVAFINPGLAELVWILAGPVQVIAMQRYRGSTPSS